MCWNEQRGPCPPYLVITASLPFTAGPAFGGTVTAAGVILAILLETGDQIQTGSKRLCTV